MEEKITTRRKVLIGMTSAVGAVGASFAVVPFVASWNPSAKAKLDDPSSLKIDEPYRDVHPTRSLSNEYTVIAGVCTHLGCAPKYYPEMESQPWDESWVGGFFCPCHGSMFDIVGRVFKGVPAPTNLKVPPHYFDGSILTIGEERGTA